MVSVKGMKWKRSSLNDPMLAERLRLKKLARSRWKSMMQRCYDPEHPNWKNYGARGIAVNKRWHDFYTFYTDIGDCPPGMTLDRPNNDGSYTPRNWRWATPEQQLTNRRSEKPRKPYKNQKFLITDQGRILPYKEAVERLGCSPNTLKDRLRRYRRKGLTQLELSELKKYERPKTSGITLDTESQDHQIAPMTPRVSPPMTKRIPPSKSPHMNTPASPAAPTSRGRKPTIKATLAVERGRGRKAAPPKAPTRRSSARVVPPSIAQVPETPTYGRTAPIPIRIGDAVRAKLQAKADRTGVPMQELIRRAIAHMLGTFRIDAVPEPVKID